MDAKALEAAIMGRHSNDLKNVLSGMTDAERGIFFRGVITGSYWSGYERGMGTAISAASVVGASKLTPKP